MGLFSKQRLDEIEAKSQTSGPLQTVLVVDDEAANRSVMAAILRPHYQVLEAADGLAAFELIQRLDGSVPLACIVSDQRMPNLTGVELFQRVQPLLPMTVRIIVTGYVDVDSIVDSINKAEIYKFIVKPFDAHDFLITVRRGVESYELQRQLEDYHRDLANQVAIRTRELEVSQAELRRANLVLQDEINERQRAEAAVRKSADQILALYNNASCGYLSLNQQGAFMQVNDTLLNWLDRTRTQLVGLSLPAIVAPHSWHHFIEHYPQIEVDGWVHELHDVELELLALDGARRVPVLLHAVVVEEDGLQVSRFTVFDITERKLSLERIAYLANHDVLTGLPNRAMMADRLQRDILRAGRNQCRVGLMFIDLDRFKYVNDSLGHHIGDQVLQQAARRLEACVRKTDSVARLGGDEFVISLGDVADARQIQTVARKVLEHLARPFEIDGHLLQLSGSVGISIYPDHGVEGDTLLRHADAAMYLAKQAGRNEFRFFDGPQGLAISG